MPGIRTSAITYRRGISNNTPNFFLFAQANYVIPQPTNKFRQNNVVAPPYTPPPNTTILVYSTTQGSSFVWSGVTFTLEPRLSNYSYTSTTTSIPATQVPAPTNLTGVTIGNSVTSIGQNAFNGCSNLTYVTIPNSVTTIGNYAFSGCTSLINIVVNSYLSNFGYGFFGVNNAGLQINFNYSGIIPNGACNGRTLMTGVTIGNQITSISDYAFQNCTSLTSIIIPDSVTSIDISAFTNCTALTTVYISSAESARLGFITSPINIPAPQFYGAPNTVSFVLPL